MSSSYPTPHESNHHRAAASYSFNNFVIYSDRQVPVAKVIDGIYNEAQELQYFVIEFFDWDPGKQILLPVHLAQVDLAAQRLFVPSLNRDQVFKTPAYNHNPAVASQSAPAHSHPTPSSDIPMRSLEQSVPLEASLPLEGYGVAHAPIPPIHPHPPTPTTAAVPPIQSTPPSVVTSADSVTAPAPAHPTQPHPRPLSPTRPPAEVTQEEVIPLREERLIVDRTKQKVGEVVVRKEIETEFIQVPIQREKLIVEQVGAEPKQLAEIDLTDEDAIAYPQRREIQLPPLPDPER